MSEPDHMLTAEQAIVALENLDNYNLMGSTISVQHSQARVPAERGATGVANKWNVTRKSTENTHVDQAASIEVENGSSKDNNLDPNLSEAVVPDKCVKELQEQAASVSKEIEKLKKSLKEAETTIMLCNIDHNIIKLKVAELEAENIAFKERHGISAIDGLAVVDEVSGAKANLPPQGELKRKDLKAGTKVWAMGINLHTKFYQATVIKVIDDEDFEVKIDEARGTGLKDLSAKYLAYWEPSDVLIPVGTRVLAGFSNRMFAGVVLEVPIITNRKRYLVLFNETYARYFEHKDIRIFCCQSTDVSNDLVSQVRQFVHVYLANFPEKSLLKLQVNQQILVNSECKWMDAKVIKIDCSLVQIKFLEKLEWIYRGSSKLKLYSPEHRVFGPGSA